MNSKTLIDTNLIVGLVTRRTSGGQQLLENLSEQGDNLVISAQGLYEFWSVATRPLSSNGLGKSSLEASLEVEAILDSFELQPDPGNLFEVWFDLCQRHQVMGRSSHDARHIAFAMASGCSKIATLDRQLYARYTEIEIISIVD